MASRGTVITLRCSAATMVTPTLMLGSNLKSWLSTTVVVSPTLRVPRSLTLAGTRSEEHTSELQSQSNLVCRLLLEKKNTQDTHDTRRTPSHRSPARTHRVHSTVHLLRPLRRHRARHGQEALHRPGAGHTRD